jgi:3-oxoacyl-[acyl-carrier protein] reductase
MMPSAFGIFWAPYKASPRNLADRVLFNKHDLLWVLASEPQIYLTGGLIMTRLKGKFALITGASGAIGRAIAVKLASEGATVAVHYGGNAGGAEETVRVIESKGGKAQAFQANTGRPAEIRRLFAKIDDAFGKRLDILVNNAGFGMMKPIMEVTEEDFDNIFAVNTKGYFFCMQEAAKRMKEGSRIINVTTTLAHARRPMTSLYAASKNAVLTFTRVAAQELGPQGITVNSVSPGPVFPGMMSKAPEEIRKHEATLSPFNRLGRPEDVADVVAFLASDDSRWVSGQDIPTNGAGNF